MSNGHRVTLVDWYIRRDLGGLYDPVNLHATFEGHPSVICGIPGRFVEFDPDAGTARSVSGTNYQFDKDSFIPNGFARNTDEAFAWINNHWMKT